MRSARLVHEKVVEFRSDRLSLDIPREGIDILDEWKIVPLTRPVVSLISITLGYCCVCMCVCVWVGVYVC